MDGLRKTSYAGSQRASAVQSAEIRDVTVGGTCWLDFPLLLKGGIRGSKRDGVFYGLAGCFYYRVRQRFTLTLLSLSVEDIDLFMSNSRHAFWAVALFLEVLFLPAAYCEERFQPVHGDPMVESWRWQVFPELNGLGSYCMAEDAGGTLWFGTADGVWSFDGNEWHSASALDLHASGSVMALCGASDGSMYAGGRWGISRFHGGVWTRIFPVKGSGVGEVRKIVFTADGDLWAATASGVLRRHGSDWILYTTPQMEKTVGTGKVLRIERWPDSLSQAPSTSGASRRHDLVTVCVGDGGALWFGTEGGELLRFIPEAEGAGPGGKERAADWTLFNEADGIVRGRRPAMLKLNDGRLWVVYEMGSGHISSFDGKTWRATPLSDLGVVSDCSHPTQTRDGTIWLSGRYVVCAFREGRWITYQKPQAPIPSAWNFLLETADGALWIGGPSTELLRVDYGTERWLTLKDLIFGCEDLSGNEWFIHRDGRVVVRRNEGWTAYSSADGVIDTPVAMIGTRSGEIWVVGSHGHEAASARYDGQRWHRFIHDEFSWGVAGTSLWEGFDGSVWFGAQVDSSGPAKHRAGILQYHNGIWIHHHQPGRAFAGGNDDDPSTLLPATQRPEPVGKFIYLAGISDGRIWAGRNLFVQRENQRWSVFTPPSPLRMGIIEAMLSTRDQGLWIGTRQFGALRFDGKEWVRFQGKDSLVANSVRSLAQTQDGSIWAATDRGISRFDGRDWTTDILPAQLNIPSEGGDLKAGRDSKIWVNRFTVDWTRRAWPRWTPTDLSKLEFETHRHSFAGVPPETEISSGLTEVDAAGNMSVLWTGSAPWRSLREARLQFSHRVDGGDWSAFSEERGMAFFSLPAGPHRLEVRARDRDFNVDPTPAVLEFTVKPPVWRQPWFILVMLGLIGAALVQSIRVILERGRLRKLNQSLAAEVRAREKTEEWLRASEADLREAQEIARFGNWSLDTVNRRLEWSDEASRIFETNTEHSTTEFHLLLARVHQDDLVMVRKAFDDAQGSGTPFDMEHRLCFPDGRIKHVNTRGRPMRDSEGRVVRILGTLQDITERKIAELHIFRLNRTYVVLSDINQLIMRARDPQTIIAGAVAVAVNKGGFEFSWIGMLEPETGRIEISAHAGEAVGVLEALKLRREDPHAPSTKEFGSANREVFNDIARDFPAGSLREVLLSRGLRSAISLPLIVDGRFAGALNLYSSELEFFDEAELRLLDELAGDIGFALEGCLHEQERRHALDELRVSEDRFRELAETIEDVFWIASPVRDKVYYVSPAFADVWGRSCQSLYERPALWTEAIHPDDRGKTLLAMAATDRGSAYEVEYRIVQPDGKIRWVRDRGFSARNPRGLESRIMGVARDITAARQMEDQFRQAQKMEAVGQLAGGVAHDFNNILAAIMIQLELASTSEHIDPEIKEYLKEINTGAERAANLTRQLLLFSRRQILQTRRLDLNEVVTSVAKMLQRLIAENIQLNLNTTDSPLYVVADAGMLDQVLLNLTVNARDAMPGGGVITIETGFREVDAELARQHSGAEPGSYVWMAVTDAGCGIPRDVMPRIFEPFFTTKEPGKGTGLGLSTVFGIVKQHRGWLRVESEPGKGARFETYLPASLEGEGVAEASLKLASLRGGAETILLVEDDRSVRMSARTLLQRYGYRVIEAEYGSQACEAWARHQVDIELLITDLVMPEHMSGQELAAILRKDKPRLKIIYTSGYSPDLMGKEIEAGCGEKFLQKPFSSEQLLAAVRACLDGQ